MTSGLCFSTYGHAVSFYEVKYIYMHAYIQTYIHICTQPLYICMLICIYIHIHIQIQVMGLQFNDIFLMSRKSAIVWKWFCMPTEISDKGVILNFSFRFKFYLSNCIYIISWSESDDVLFLPWSNAHWLAQWRDESQQVPILYNFEGQSWIVWTHEL